MRLSFCSFCLIISILSFPISASAQTINFDETWKEFLENDKISNMSELVKPNKYYDLPDYAKYLLMNTNSSFCQSDLEDAEGMMEEIQAIDTALLGSIEGFVAKMEGLQAKIQAYHTMDAIWERFLETKEVSPDELEAVTAAKTSCEKSTLAKYSYMTAHHHFCRGDIAQAKNIFENRTLKLIEKTSLRVEDVEGLASEAARMKAMFQGMAQLDVAWKTYLQTGVSPGFDLELPLFPCYPVPNMKVCVLRGVLDICETGPAMLEKIKSMQAESGVAPEGDLAKKVKELEAAVGKNEGNLAVLNEAWESFLKDNKVSHLGKYGYEYCTTEPLIRAYIMDGFAFACETAAEMLEKIDDIQIEEEVELEAITLAKIGELAELYEQYQSNGVKIEKVWKKFVSQGDKPQSNFESTDQYCDNIQQVKDWTIAGLSSDCEEAYPYLDKIEEFQQTFDFSFTEELDCRVQKLRIKVWECRYQLIEELARVEASPETFEERLEELLEEYGMGERPEPCAKNK